MQKLLAIFLCLYCQFSLQAQKTEELVADDTLMALRASSLNEVKALFAKELQEQMLMAEMMAQSY